MDNENQYFDNLNQEDGTQEHLPQQQAAPVAPAAVARQKKTSGSKAGVFITGMFVGMVVGLLCFTTIFWCFVLRNMALRNSTPEIAGAQQGSQQSAQQGNTQQELVLSENSLIDKDFLTKIAQLERLIDKEFYLHEVTKEELETGIYKGMVAALNDIYSEYYTPEELESLLSSSAGTYYGIGAYVGIDETVKLPKISSVIKNSPAEAAQLRANDLIYEVAGESTQGLSLTEVVTLIKGPVGSEVVLGIIRDNKKMDVTVSRAKVETPTVESKMLEGNMGYLKLTEFDDVSEKQFADALQKLKDDGMQGMILDLRGNPGGNLTTVVEIAKMLLPEGLIVYTEDKAGKKETFKCNGKNKFDLPLVVLINSNSASAAEILSGAIQDHQIGTLVGTTTFGKGIVQAVLPLKDGAGVKLTISSYYTPSGRNIHGTGIEPDIVCELDQDAYYASNGEKDNQLDKAIEVLGELMAK